MFTNAILETLLRIGCLAAATALAGCAEDGSERLAARGDSASGSGFYQCSQEHFVARFDEDSALLTLPDRTVRLPRAIAASGSKYSDGDLTLWSRGETATLTGTDRATAHCRLREAAGAWEDARLRGIDFRAVGRTPEWVLEIDRGDSVYLTLEDRAAPIILPAPVAAFDPESEQTIYRVRSKSHTLVVTVYGDPCDEPNGGERFLSAVAVRLDDRELQGCGRPIY